MALTGLQGYFDTVRKNANSRSHAAAALANQRIQQLAKQLQGALPIIGVGGILTGANAAEKIAAGASLVQVYSGLIYQGPALVHEVCRAIG